jgi:tetratricopeptide (TPR) repeat protein
LAGLRSLTVRSSRLAEQLAKGDQDPRRIGREADVDFVLTGSILCDAGRLRVFAEIVQAATGAVAGSCACHAKGDDIFDIQDTLTRRIVELVRPRLSDHESRTLSHDVPTSARAYEFYLRGAHIERDRTFENISMARDLYRQSLEADPDYAPAWARLGRCYRFLEKFDPDESNTSELTQWAFRRAFALNPDLPMAHNHYTQIEADSGQAQRAMIRLLGQARKYPNDPELFSGLVQATRYCGLLDESLRAHQHARKLDPHAVTSVAHTYFLMGDYQRTLDWYPRGSRFYLDAAALAAAGRETEAAGLLANRSFLTPLVDSLRRCLGNDHAGSIAIAMRAIQSDRATEPEMKFYFARHLARGGAVQDALKALHQLAAGGFVCSTAMERDPWLRPLSSLPDFPGVLSAIVKREADATSAFQAAEGNQILPK